VKTGIQENQFLMDSRFRGSDGLGDFLRDHQGIGNKKEAEDYQPLLWIVKIYGTK